MEQPSGLTLFLRYLRRNKGLAVGLIILIALILFILILLIRPQGLLGRAGMEDVGMK